MTDQSVGNRPAALPLDSARRRAPDERPQQIVDAALLVFGEHGLAGARLDEIAQRAGIAKGTIYLYFPNKEELFREVVRRTIVARLDLVEQTLARDGDQGPEAQLRTFMHSWWEFACRADFQAVYRLVVGELHRFPDLADFYIREVAGRAMRIVGGVVSRGIAQGVFRRVDPQATTRMVASLIITQASWAQKTLAAVIEHAGGMPPDAMRDQVCDFVLAALRPDRGAEEEA